MNFVYAFMLETLNFACEIYLCFIFASLLKIIIFGDTKRIVDTKDHCYYCGNYDVMGKHKHHD